jgi:hypothetical protein
MVNAEVPPIAAVRVRLLRQAVELRPDSAALLFNLADALMEEGDPDEAAECYRRAVLLAPGANFPGPALARALVERGVLLPQVLAGLAIAASQEGRIDEVRRLIDYRRFARQVPFPVPDGFDREDFYFRLAAELRSDLTYYTGEGKEPARNTWQNDSITKTRFPAWVACRKALEGVIDRYIEGLPTEDSHPFLAARPARFRLDGWAVVTREDGQIGSHFHPRAWITTVLYVVRPPASRVPGSKAGWLEVGPPDGCGELPGWETWHVEPEPGTLLILPGYYFHRTLPYDADEERISLVVDVMIPEFPGQGRSS